MVTSFWMVLSSIVIGVSSPSWRTSRSRALALKALNTLRRIVMLEMAVALLV